MIERAYTLDEIDRLRMATRTWYQYDLVMSSDPDREGKKDRIVEEKLRTFMMNGTDPAEIEEKIAARRRMRDAKRNGVVVLTGKPDRALGAKIRRQ
jgi:hypothetical protein